MERYREDTFYLIPVEIDFYGKISRSLVLHAIELVYLSDVPFDAILNKDINHSMEFPMILFHHTSAFSTHCVISLNLSNLMKRSIMFIRW